MNRILVMNNSDLGLFRCGITKTVQPPLCNITEQLSLTLHKQIKVKLCLGENDHHWKNPSAILLESCQNIM